LTITPKEQNTQEFKDNEMLRCGVSAITQWDWWCLGNNGPQVFFVFFCLFVVFIVVIVAISWAAPAAYGGSQARG